MWKFLDFYNADIDFWWIIFNETNIKTNKQKKNSKSVIMSSNDVNKTAFLLIFAKKNHLFN